MNAEDQAAIDRGYAEALRIVLERLKKEATK
jgi:hypothetical protein